jgi:hypothetical protein
LASTAGGILHFFRDNGTEFAVSGVPSTVAPGASAPFTLTYTPTAGVSTSRATVTINNSDANEAAYDFIVEGEKSLPIAGETWTARHDNRIDGEVSVAYGNGVFVAVSNYGTNRVMTSSPSNAAAALTNWAAAQGQTGNNGLPTATPFNDDVSNLLKYAFNMPLDGPRTHTFVPGSGAGGLPLSTTSLSGPTPIFHVQYLRRRNSGLVYTPRRPPSSAASP